MEIWEILDNNGNKTGKTMQKDDEKVWQKGIYHRGADVWIINSEKKILIQKRAKEKKLFQNRKCMGRAICSTPRHKFGRSSYAKRRSTRSKICNF